MRLPTVSWAHPAVKGAFSKWVASHELIQCSYYFKTDYVFLFFFFLNSHIELRLTMCQTILHRGTQKEMIVFKHRNICRLDTMNESTIFSIKQSHRLFVVVKFNCKKKKPTLTAYLNLEKYWILFADWQFFYLSMHVCVMVWHPLR